MISRSMPALVAVTLAASAAVLFVAALRVPVRRAVGARAAYWLWLSVPASVLAVLLPAPLHALRIPAATPAIDMAIPAFEFEIPSAPATPFAAGMRAGPAVQCPASRHRSGTKT